MAYCKVSPESDVYAYFHRMGYLICETCKWIGLSKNGLFIHLESHRSKGDRVPQSAFDRLRKEMESNWV